MRIDWRGLLRNRWTWVALAGAAAAGGVVLLRRRSTGAGTGGAGGGLDPEATGSGYFDSTATDVAEQLGQAQQGWQRMFDVFSASVNEKLSQIPTADDAPPPITPAASAPGWTAVASPPPPITPPAAPPATQTRFDPVVTQVLNERVAAGIPTLPRIAASRASTPAGRGHLEF